MRIWYQRVRAILFSAALCLSCLCPVYADVVPTEYDVGSFHNAVYPSLTITKQVTGSMGSKDQYFEIELVLTGDTSGEVDIDLSRADKAMEGDLSNPETGSLGSPIRFYLQSGQSVSIKNIPPGTKYKITEKDFGHGYEASYEIQDGTASTTKKGYTASGSIEKDSVTATLTNTRDSAVPTGIILASSPYLILLSGSLLIIIFLRREKNRQG